MSRCLSVRERFEELTHRHRGQINAVRPHPLSTTVKRANRMMCARV
jgi:hypothetical protein